MRAFFASLLLVGLAATGAAGCFAEPCAGDCVDYTLDVVVEDAATHVPVCDATVVAQAEDGEPPEHLLVTRGEDGACHYRGGSRDGAFTVRVEAPAYAAAESTVRVPRSGECCPVGGGTIELARD